MIRLLIADDHEGVRHGLRDLFTAEPDIAVVAECSDGDEVLEAAAQTRPHVALLDVVMSRVGGLEAAGRLLSLEPSPRVVLFTGTGSAQLARDAREIGAAGFLLKGHHADELAAHIRAVAAGGTAFASLL